MNKQVDIVKLNVVREVEAAKDLIAALNSPDEDLNHDMVEGETGLFEAIEVALDEIRECDIQASGIKDKVEQLSKRKTRVTKRKDHLKGLIEQAFAVAEIKAHKFPCETLTVKSTPPKLIVTDEAVIPSKFWEKQPPKLDRSELLKSVKSEKVTGAELSNGGTTLQIRSA